MVLKYRGILSLDCIDLIKMSLNTFAERVDQDQAVFVRAALSGSTFIAYGNMIRYDLTLVISMYLPPLYLYNYS